MIHAKSGLSTSRGLPPSSQFVPLRREGGARPMLLLPAARLGLLPASLSTGVQGRFTEAGNINSLTLKVHEEASSGTGNLV